MLVFRRLACVGLLLGLASWLSTSLRGQSGKPAEKTSASRQIAPGNKAEPDGDEAPSRFSIPGALAYAPVAGDRYFALQITPKLDAMPARPRDFLILMSTAATQGGPHWTAGHHIAEAILESAGPHDRVSLWTVNAPAHTRNLTRAFLIPKDYTDGKRLRDALAKYRANEFPAGDTDLKNALTQALRTFDAAKDRQRIILFLGDGLSTHNPMSSADRYTIAKQMVERKIAFYPVPLGVQLDPEALHTLATATGGAVLRTNVEEEKLVDALKRYEAAFGAPVLYAAQLQLPAGVSDVCPAVLPPLRGDTPTLIVGRMKASIQRIDYTITGRVPGLKGVVSLAGNETVQAPGLDNYFLVGMHEQWLKGRNAPAILRGDRALALAYEQTRLQHRECLEGAQLALSEDQFDAAHRLFEAARILAPHDRQAEAGIQIVDRLKDGTLKRDDLRKQLRNRVGKADRLQLVNGKPQWVKVDLAALAQEPPAAPAAKKQPGIGPDNLLKEHRDRQAIEEQKTTAAVEDALGTARRQVKNDPDGTLDLLRNVLRRVQDHPDLGAKVREALRERLQTALRGAAIDVRARKLEKQEQAQAEAQAQANLRREQERATFEDRIDAQFRVYKSLMNQARFEVRTQAEVLQAMVQIQDEARRQGAASPVAAKAIYDIALASNPSQSHNALVRQREEKWLAVLMQVEKSHVPFPDEPGIHFPPLVTWKALIKARKDKYEVSSLPDDEEGRREASEIYRLLQQPIETKGLTERIKLKTALEYIADKFGGKLPILVDKEAFIAEFGADAPDPYEEEVVLPPVPTRMVMNTALRLILSQVGKGNATYLIRRSFIEITTNKRYLEDKVIRIYPVGDLALPLSNTGPFGGGFGTPIGGGFGGGFGGGIPGGFGGAIAGGFGGGIPGGFGGGIPGGFGGGIPGGFGGGFGQPFGGGFGGGIPGGFGGGIPGGFGGGFGQPFGGGFGGGIPGGFGGGIPGGFGGGFGVPFGGGFGGGGFPGAQFTGGSFQGSFNGSLGFQGATQATGLIDIITRIVDPGNWNRPPQLNPFMGGFPGPGMFGMIGMIGMNGMGMIGAGPPPDPNVNVDPQTSNSIDFFPPALALIVRAPSRMHTSITGGIVGGRARRLEAAASLDREIKNIAVAKNGRNPNVKVAGAQGGDDAKVAAKKHEPIDPAKVWNEALAKGGVDAGHIIAAADFLFDTGEFKHAAELLKATLRRGNVARPWVYEALAVALEASGGDMEEIRRVRLSGIALDPTDAQGFLSAARAMADRGEFARALAFCRQAAELQPNDRQPFEAALVYAETAKDAGAMAWAVGRLLSQDWPSDNRAIQRDAHKRLTSLSATLKTEKRHEDARRLEAALAKLNRRDLIVRLLWSNAAAPCELDLRVREPSGATCSPAQTQTPGGGILIGCDILAKDPSAQYIAAQAFSGDYEISVSRLYGQPLGNRARLEIIQHAGTPNESRRLEIVRLDNNAPIKLTLTNGRRAELAVVTPAAPRRAHAERGSESAFQALRAAADPNFAGVKGPRGGAGAAGSQRPTPGWTEALAKKAGGGAITQNALTPQAGNLPMTTQVRLSPDQLRLDLVIRPYFQGAAAASQRAGVPLSVIPGGSN